MSRVYLSPPHLSGREAELVADAIASNWIAPLGPHVDAFEAELAAAVGVEHAVALSSGTAALHLALVVLGIGAGDEVACSALHVRRERERRHVLRRHAVLRRRDRGDLDAGPGPPRPCDRVTPGGRRQRSARSSPSISTASAATTRPSPRSARGTTSRSSRMPRSRSVRPTAGDLPAARERSRRSPSTGTRSSRRAAAACSCRGSATGSSTRASSRRRRASRRRTTSTSRSGSTTG